jgi:hypothetical protein
MTSSTSMTKAQLADQLAAAQLRISELEQQLSEMPETRRENNGLAQTVWLQAAAPTGEYDKGTTTGGKRYIRFRAQFGRVDRESGERRYGARKEYVAYGDLATAVNDHFSSTEDRLVHIEAFERPYHGTGERRNERHSEWVVTSFTPILRQAPAEQQEEAASEPQFAGEPSSEEVPF